MRGYPVFIFTAADLWSVSYSYFHNFHLLLGLEHADVNLYDDSDVIAQMLIGRSICQSNSYAWFKFHLRSQVIETKIFPKVREIDKWKHYQLNI